MQLASAKPLTSKLLCWEKFLFCWNSDGENIKLQLFCCNFEYIIQKYEKNVLAKLFVSWENNILFNSIVVHILLFSYSLFFPVKYGTFPKGCNERESSIIFHRKKNLFIVFLLLHFCYRENSFLFLSMMTENRIKKKKICRENPEKNWTSLNLLKLVSIRFYY